MHKIINLLSFFIAFGILPATAQRPKYTPKKFVTTLDTAEFRNTSENGLRKTYMLDRPEIWDVDDLNTTHIRFSEPALLYFEGTETNGKKNGITTVYLIDSLDHNHRYKIWEQTYVDDELTGPWKFYNLKGICIGVDSFVKAEPVGVSKRFWIDGVTLMQKVEYLENNRTIHRQYQNGKLRREVPFLNDQIDGVAKGFYEDGKTEEESVFSKGERNGYRKYYYPTGQLWLEMEFKEGKEWNAISNYDEKGHKRKAGSLKNGNGSLIFYNEDGTVRETQYFKNGLPVK